MMLGIPMDKRLEGRVLKINGFLKEIAERQSDVGDIPGVHAVIEVQNAHGTVSPEKIVKLEVGMYQPEHLPIRREGLEERADSLVLLSNDQPVSLQVGPYHVQLILPGASPPPRLPRVPPQRAMECSQCRAPRTKVRGVHVVNLSLLATEGRKDDCVKDSPVRPDRFYQVSVPRWDGRRHGHSLPIEPAEQVHLRLDAIPGALRAIRKPETVWLARIVEEVEEVRARAEEASGERVVVPVLEDGFGHRATPIWSRHAIHPPHRAQRHHAQAYQRVSVHGQSSEACRGGGSSSVRYLTSRGAPYGQTLSCPTQYW